jgi:hypothetical protein
LDESLHKTNDESAQRTVFHIDPALSQLFRELQHDLDDKTKKLKEASDHAKAAQFNTQS